MEVTKFYNENQPIATQIKGMQKGETIAFPIEKLGYLRSNLSTFALVSRCKFASHINRATGTLEVSRIE